MMNSAEDFMRKKLDERKSIAAFRSLKKREDKIDFFSNDYLGIASKDFSIHPEPLNLHQRNGSAGSRLLAGHSEEAEMLEDWIREAFNANAALVFNSGFDANLGILSTLPGRNDTVFYDSLVHASLREGIRLSSCNAYSFKHNAPDDLRNKSALAKGIVYVVVETVYSMDGDEPDLSAFLTVCKEFGWHLIVDEAHGLGIRGDSGKGASFSYAGSDDIFARVLTFGKAAGFHGAAVLGSQVLIDYLINFCRPFIYSTALPPSDYVKLQLMLSNMLEADQERKQLSMLVDQFRLWQLNQLKFQFISSQSPIQNLIVPGNVEVTQLANHLQLNGYDVRPIKSPTVPAGSERLRIILHSFNTTAELDGMISHLENYSGTD
jgi:8-amino-7-oxononanoate synthase